MCVFLLISSQNAKPKWKKNINYKSIIGILNSIRMIRMLMLEHIQHLQSSAIINYYIKWF